jgi:hypothetical protein
MKQTAVEWLLGQLPTIDKYDPYYADIITQAKEMEKLENNKYICIKCKCKIDEEVHKVSD